MNKMLEETYQSQKQIFDEVLTQMGAEALYYDLEKDELVVCEKGKREQISIPHFESYLFRGEILHPLDHRKAKEYVQRLKRGENPGAIRVRWHNCVGAEFEYYRVMFRFIGEDKQLAVGSALNITEEIRLEERLEQITPQVMSDEETLERMLMRYASQKQFYMMLVIDGETGHAKELVEPFDTNCGRFIDIANIDVNSEKYFRKNVAPEEVEEIIKKTRLPYVIQKLESEGQYVIFFKGKNVLGLVKFFRGEFSYLNREAKLIYYSATDITADVMQNREFERSMRQSYERESNAIKAKDAFFSNMSHEIRTPLNAIVGMAEIAKMDIKNPKKVEECMDILLSASQSLGRVVSDILDASSLQTGGIKLTPSVNNLQVVLEQIREEFESSFKKKHQKFKLVTDVTHNSVVIDAERAKRVALNILGNSAKFSPENGIIQLKVTELPGKKPMECILKIEVSDNGKGICKEDISHVFEPFYRDKESENNYVAGTGLGLSVVKNIVDEKGATITIESEPEKGTVVTILNPVKYVDDKPRSVVNKERVLAGKRVLLVEDQPINMLVARKMLERFGAKVDTAEHGKLAVDSFMKQNSSYYDMIFMDIQMPIMDGYEATRQIRNSGREDAQTVKIISMTANVLAEDITKAKEAGMDAHIGKPIRSEELQQLIAEVLNM